ncbi:MAG: methyl-accepting chemotaxis protein [Phycisphaerales bacterium]|nr:methyl-accepting chemotaxis protein [Phycisphaerales bacterium]
MSSESDINQIAAVPLIRGLLGRMLLVGVLPTILVIGGLLWLETKHEYEALQDASLDQLQARADLLAETIQDVNKSARESVLAMADAQAAGMIRHGQMSVDFSRSILEREAEITAVFMAFEPGVHSPSEIADLPAEALTKSGRLAPYWFIDPDHGDTIRLQQTPQLDTGEYYAIPREQWKASGDGSMSISEPYLNDGRLQIDMSAPMIVEGDFVGIAGVGRALDDQDIQIRSFLSGTDDDAYLISPYGKFIAASVDEYRLDDRDLSGLLKTRSMDDVGYGELLGPVYSGMQEDVFLGTDPHDGHEYFYASADIQTGDWTVVVRRSKASVVDPIWEYLVESITLGVVGIIVIIILLSALAISISRRVRIAVDRASRVAQGDLRASDAESYAGDETGLLLRVMERMSERLRGLVGHLVQSGQAIDQTASVLVSSTNDQADVANSLDQSTRKITDAVDRIMSTSGELEQTVASVSAAADQTSKLASDGKQELQGMQSAMSQLEASTEAADRRLTTIQERAAGITGIISTITSVADQTNLLSVNASIEAEKAGEAGRGFLVVAREIRRLADRSASATLEVESSVREVEQAIGEGVQDLGRFSEEVRRIVVDVKAISEAMSAIIEQVTVSTERFHSLREGVASQTEGAQAIADTMGGLQEGTDRTLRTTDSLVRASGDLERAVDTLGEIVSSFELGDAVSNPKD